METVFGKTEIRRKRISQRDMWRSKWQKATEFVVYYINYVEIEMFSSSRICCLSFLMWSFLKVSTVESWTTHRTVWFMGNLFKAAMECEERSRRMNVIKEYLLSVRSFVSNKTGRPVRVTSLRTTRRWDTPVCVYFQTKLFVKPNWIFYFS